MHLLNHSLSHYFSKVVHHGHSESPVLYHTSSLDVWPSELIDKPDRFVTKIESCSAHTITPGNGASSPVVDKEHYHTFLRVMLAPTPDHPEETIFVERVLTERGKAPHSVIPLEADAGMAAFSDANGDALHDHACVILQGSPSALIHAHHLRIDRTIHFSRCPDRQLSLYELATLLQFISAHGLRAVSIGLDTACETYSKWFSRATMSALAPLIMRGAFRHLTPPKEEAGVRVEIAMQRSVNAWLESTFKAYPLEEVAAVNLTRQINAMSEEDKRKKMQQIAKRKEELVFKAMIEAAYQVHKAAQVEWAKSREDVTARKLTRRQSAKMAKRKEDATFQAMMEAAIQVRETHSRLVQSKSFP